MTLEQFYFFCFYADLASYLPPLWVGGKQYKQLPVYLKVFFFFLLFSLLIGVVSWVLGMVFHIHNVFLNYINVAVSIATKMYLFRSFISDDKMRKWVTWAGCALLLLVILEAVWLSGLKNFPAWTGFLKFLWILTFGVYCLRQLITVAEVSLKQYAMFWILSGILINSTLAFAYDSTSNVLLNSSVTLFFIFSYIAILSDVFANVLFTVGFAKVEKSPKDAFLNTYT
jgi:hypothetical protein